MRKHSIRVGISGEAYLQLGRFFRGTDTASVCRLDQQVTRARFLVCRLVSDSPPDFCQSILFFFPFPFYLSRTKTKNNRQSIFFCSLTLYFHVTRIHQGLCAIFWISWWLPGILCDELQQLFLVLLAEQWLARRIATYKEIARAGEQHKDSSQAHEHEKVPFQDVDPKIVPLLPPVPPVSYDSTSINHHHATTMNIIMIIRETRYILLFITTQAQSYRISSPPD